MTSQAHKDAARLVALYAAAREAKATARPWDALALVLFEALRRFLADEAASLAANVLLVGNAGGADDVTWWTNHRAALLDELNAGLGAIARLGAQEGRGALLSASLSINWGLVNQNAVRAAQAHAAGALISGIEQTTRQAVREAVAEWVNSGEPLPALADKIQRLTEFSAERARLIAQTESTNAFATGNAQAWEASGVAPAAFIPSAHPGCRCYLQPLRLDDGSSVMVWYTAVDERVCTQPIDTPWGVVAGCKALHQTIVSRGALMGTKKP